MFTIKLVFLTIIAFNNITCDDFDRYKEAYEYISKDGILKEEFYRSNSKRNNTNIFVSKEILSFSNLNPMDSNLAIFKDTLKNFIPTGVIDYFCELDELNTPKEEYDGVLFFSEFYGDLLIAELRFLHSKGGVLHLFIHDSDTVAIKNYDKTLDYRYSLVGDIGDYIRFFFYFDNGKLNKVYHIYGTED